MMLIKGIGPEAGPTSEEAPSDPLDRLLWSGTSRGWPQGDAVLVRKDVPPSAGEGPALSRGQRGVVVVVAPDGSTRIEPRGGGAPWVVRVGDRRCLARLPFEEDDRVVVRRAIPGVAARFS